MRFNTILDRTHGSLRGACGPLCRLLARPVPRDYQAPLEDHRGVLVDAIELPSAPSVELQFHFGDC